MPFDNTEAAIAARQIITDRSPSAVGISIPRIVAMIPTALNLWRDKMQNNPSARAILRTTISVEVAGGAVDLTSYVDGTNNQISLQDLRNSTIYTTIDSVRTPFTWVASQQQLNYGRQLDTDSPACFLDGYTLRTRDVDGTTNGFAGTIEFTAVDYPTTVTGIPNFLQEDFVLILADLVLRQTEANNGN